MLNDIQEHQEMEFKSSWQDEFLKWLCGYANADGGTILIGVNDDGYVIGVNNHSRLLESIPNRIIDKLGIVPSVRLREAHGAENLKYGEAVPPEVAAKLSNQYACGKVHLEDFPVGSSKYKSLSALMGQTSINESANGIRSYIEIQVSKYRTAVSCDGRYYKRSGSTLRELTGNELTSFLLQRSGSSWDEVPIPGFTVSDLSHSAMDVFRAKAIATGKDEGHNQISDEMLLQNLNLFSDKDLIRAALLLFHPEPVLFSRGAYIRIARFETVGNGNAKAEVLKYQDIIEGPLISQADLAMECIYQKYFKALISFNGLQRIENYMIPKSILRELLMNAIIHKDYAISTPINIAIYDDRISIHNIGEWPADIPSDERIYDSKISQPHNRTLAQVFFAAGEVEAWGTGFRTIKRVCNSSSTPLPILSIGTSNIVVIAHCSDVYRSLKEDYETSSKESNDASSDGNASIPHNVYMTLSDFSSRNFIPLETLCSLYRNLQEPITKKQMLACPRSDNSSNWAFWNYVIKPLIQEGLVCYTLPDKPNSSKQRYFWTKADEI